MNLPSILLWGFVATLILSTVMEGSRGLGWSRMSIPFIVGTMFTPSYDRAVPIGFAVHFINGWAIALLYGVIFQDLHRATWWLGAAFGAVQGAVMLMMILPLMPFVHPRMATEHSGPEPTTGLEPPGFLGLNYGRRTPVFTMIAHVLYGLILGAGYRLSA
ncbi:MAG: hypothetical protein ACREL5_12740 [Gemmatimonadales bacterium]